MSTEPVRVAFVCVRNAGRSQMAAAFAEREVRARGLEDTVEIRSGGTSPAASVHDVVREAMAEIGIDLSDRTTREITTAELESCAYVVTMGCSTLELDPAVEAREWTLEDPDGRPLEVVREIRDDVRDRVRGLFDELEREVIPRV